MTLNPEVTAYILFFALYYTSNRRIHKSRVYSISVLASYEVITFFTLNELLTNERLTALLNKICEYT